MTSLYAGMSPDEMITAVDWVNQWLWAIRENTMQKFVCSKCDNECHSADGTHAIRCPYCHASGLKPEPVRQEEVKG